MLISIYMSIQIAPTPPLFFFLYKYSLFPPYLRSCPHAALPISVARPLTVARRTGDLLQADGNPRCSDEPPRRMLQRGDAGRLEPRPGPPFDVDRRPGRDHEQRAPAAGDLVARAAVRASRGAGVERRPAKLEGWAGHRRD